MQPISFGQSVYSIIDSTVKEQVKQSNFNGCVLAIDGEKTVYQKCYGYADYDAAAPLNEETVFDLASLTKLFTASAIPF